MNLFRRSAGKENLAIEEVLEDTVADLSQFESVAELVYAPDLKSGTLVVQIHPLSPLTSGSSDG